MDFVDGAESLNGGGGRFDEGGASVGWLSRYLWVYRRVHLFHVSLSLLFFFLNFYFLPYRSQMESDDREFVLLRGFGFLKARIMDACRLIRGRNCGIRGNFHA